MKDFFQYRESLSEQVKNGKVWSMKKQKWVDIKPGEKYWDRNKKKWFIYGDKTANKDSNSDRLRKSKIEIEDFEGVWGELFDDLPNAFAHTDDESDDDFAETTSEAFDDLLSSSKMVGKTDSGHAVYQSLSSKSQYLKNWGWTDKYVYFFMKPAAKLYKRNYRPNKGIMIATGNLSLKKSDLPEIGKMLKR